MSDIEELREALDKISDVFGKLSNRLGSASVEESSH
jgi:hypothetical protein